MKHPENATRETWDTVSQILDMWCNMASGFGRRIWCTTHHCQSHQIVIQTERVCETQPPVQPVGDDGDRKKCTKYRWQGDMLVSQQGVTSPWDRIGLIWDILSDITQSGAHFERYDKEVLVGYQVLQSRRRLLPLSALGGSKIEIMLGKSTPGYQATERQRENEKETLWTEGNPHCL